MTDHLPPTPRYPWEQREGETHKAYLAFSAYRNLGPNRSMSRAISEMPESNRGGKPETTRRWWETWSSRYDWIERAKAWDLEQERLRRVALQREAVEMGKRQAQAAYDLELVMLAPVRALVARMSDAIEGRAVEDWLENLSPGEAIALATSVAKVYPQLARLERLARGEPTEIPGETVAPTLTTEPADESYIAATIKAFEEAGVPVDRRSE